MHCFWIKGIAFRNVDKTFKLNAFLQKINNLGFKLPSDAITGLLYQKWDLQNNSEDAGSDTTTPDQWQYFPSSN